MHINYTDLLSAKKIHRIMEAKQIILLIFGGFFALHTLLF